MAEKQTMKLAEVRESTKCFAKGWVLKERDVTRKQSKQGLRNEEREREGRLRDREE